MKKIFWGLIFLMININIGYFQVFGELVGIVLIYSGSKEFEGLKEEFKFAMELSMISFVIVAIRWVFGINIFTQGLFFLPKICMIYMLCKGIEQLYSNCSELGIIKWYKGYLIITSIRLIFSIFNNSIGQMLWLIECVCIFLLLRSILKITQSEKHENEREY